MRAERGCDEFTTVLVSIAHRVSRLEREQVCYGELTFQQFQTLRRLDQARDTVSAIAEVLGIDDSTASRNVAILVRDGYLNKRRDGEDARTHRLVLTGKGRAALTNLQCGEREVFAAVWKRLSSVERVAVMNALGTVRSALSHDASRDLASNRPAAIKSQGDGAAR